MCAQDQINEWTFLYAIHNFVHPFYVFTAASASENPPLLDVYGAKCAKIDQRKYLVIGLLMLNIVGGNKRSEVLISRN